VQLYILTDKNLLQLTAPAFDIATGFSFEAEDTVVFPHSDFIAIAVSV